MSGRSRPRWLACVIVLVAPLACSDRRDDVVARIGDEVVTIEEVEVYFAANLDEDWGEEALTDDELALIRSRLFDAFLEERILLHEARRRGIGASDAEVDAFLRSGRGGAGEGGAPGDAPDASGHLASARRTVRIQKLIDRIAGEAAEIDEDDVDAWLRQLHGTERGASERVVLRSLLLPSEEPADRGSREIRRRRMTFDEVVALHEQTPDQSAPVELDVDDLPPNVREAIADLKDGGVSAPVELNGEFFLFQVVRRGQATDSARAEGERDNARRDLQERLYLQTSRRLLEQLRAELTIETWPEHLPFPYVPEQVIP